MIEVVFLFWASVLILVYTYIGYPIIVGAWATFRSRPPRRRNIEPTVSVVVVAYNEAGRIERRLENLLALSYPKDRLEILLASDGSTDGTPELAQLYEKTGVTVIAFEERRGKAAVLNAVVPKVRGEIVVLVDARQTFDDGALRELVKAFVESNVGAVSGELILTAADERNTHVEDGIGFYWRYETFIRWNESQVDSTIGATGAIYAIRRELFEPIPTDTILDDVLIPMRIVRRGYRVLFQPKARAYEQIAAEAHKEFTRKVRTIAGNFQLLVRERWLLNPFQNRLWFQTVSHKCLRLLGPILLTMAFALNLLLLDQLLYRWTLAAQCIFYMSALGGYLARGSQRKVPFLGVAFAFCLLNWATVVAFVRFISGRQRVTWKKVL